MPGSQRFSANLQFAIRALSLSRSRVAAAIGVDKSVVGRWCSGAVHPSAHNLEQLTGFVAGRIPGFTMLDWDLVPAALAERLGVSPPAVPVGTGLDLASLLPAGLLDEALATARLRGGAYEGFWRTTRPSAELGGRFVHDHLLLRREANGLLRYRLGVFDLRFDGWSLPIQNQLFSLAADAVSGVFIFSILNGVASRKAAVLDGIALTCMRNLDGDIVATPCLFERVGDLTGDAEADERALNALLAEPPLAPEDSVPAQIRDHLLRDVGPLAAASGGDLLMVMQFAHSLSRGAPLGGGIFMAP